MNIVVIVLLAVVFIAVCVGAYAWFAPAKETPAETPPPAIEPWTPDAGWSAQAGEEFATLSEAARCDLVFAVADLQDERAEGLLLHALDDPSEAVALAAAHVLERRGAAAAVREHVNRYPGKRARRIAETLALLQ